MNAENHPKPRRPLRHALIVVVLAGLIGGVWYWSNHQAQSPGAAHEGRAGMRGQGGIQPVSVEAARKTDIRIWLSALGTVTPADLVTVRAKVDGTLLKVNFKEGQMVKAGQVLAEIDPRPFQIQLDQAKGQLVRDTALLDNARLDLARYRTLQAKDAIPGQQLDTQGALVRQYEGTVATDRAQVANAALQLEWTRITAPVSGRIGLRQLDPGNQIHAADANGLATIARMEPAMALFSVPQANLPAISQRLAGRARLKVEAWDQGQQNRLADGRVLTTDNQIDPTTGTIKVKAEFADNDRLFPNQFVNVRLLLDTLHDVVAVPTAAVLRGDKGSYVYRVGTDGKVAMVPVTPGSVDGDWMAATGDIQPGDRLVTDGTDKLRDGAQVEVIVPGAAHAAGKKGGQHRQGGGKKHGANSGE